VLRVDYLSIAGLPPLSFEVAPGQCLAIEGPSGSGKTRLLRAIADLDPADGYVFLDGVERAEIAGPLWRRRVRFVSAEPAWWAPTARAHFGAAAKLDRLLAALGLEHLDLDGPVAALSTGERQRLALVRAVADDPPVLLLDEPTSALAATNAALASEFIKFQILAGRIVLLVSHDIVQIERLATARLHLGEVAWPPTSESAAA
jgi:ABC-type multidrug transport system ATPase subunit